MTTHTESEYNTVLIIPITCHSNDVMCCHHREQSCSIRRTTLHAQRVQTILQVKCPQADFMWEILNLHVNKALIHDLKHSATSRPMLNTVVARLITITCTNVQSQVLNQI